MHSRGNPKDMNSLAIYNNVVEDVITEINMQLDECRKAGINE